MSEDASKVSFSACFFFDSLYSLPTSRCRNSLESWPVVFPTHNIRKSYSNASKTFFIQILIAPAFAALFDMVPELVVVAADVALLQVVDAQLKRVLLLRLRLLLHALLLEVPELLGDVALLVQKLALLLDYFLQLDYFLHFLIEVLQLVQSFIFANLLFDLPAQLLSANQQRLKR